ncbi:MAG: tripartite tricarboxylate transporter substrate binding protein, partial [Acidovorax sp.]|nr:tripartite tricarboxylate transporter substrate binding protein [Acidovorax sp.]
EYGGMTQQQFAGMVSSEVRRWATVVKASGAKLD